MAENKTLSMETFNEILFGALKPEVKKSELLAEELAFAMGIKLNHFDELFSAILEDYLHIKLTDRVAGIVQTLINVDANCDRLAEMIEEAKAEEAENEKTN